MIIFELYDIRVKSDCVHKQSSIVLLKGNEIQKSSNDFPANIIITTFVHIQFSFLYLASKI